MPLFNIRKYQELAKGFQGRSKNCPKTMYNKVQKSLQYSFRERHRRPRILRREWIQSINAAVREHGINYSRFLFGLTWSNIHLNRKIMQDLAVNEPYSFKALVDEVKIQGQLKEKPKQEITLLDAYERGLLADTPKIWYKKVAQRPYQYGGIIDEDKLTPEQIQKLKKT